jgi:hypothetical protein
MDKELIKHLYSIGDSKRKKVLYEVYKDLFLQKLSIEFTAKQLNEYLGEEMVSIIDIKYIRRHFVRGQVQDFKKIASITSKIEGGTISNPNFDSELEDLFDDSKIVQRLEKAAEERKKNRKW